MRNKNTIDSVLLKTKKSPNSTCIEWVGCRGKHGYGKVVINGRHRRSHCVVWEYYNEKEIPNGLYVLHSCDNPSCVNPSHLRIGTAKDNADDCKQRKRTCKGQKNNKCKLSEEKVKEVRQLYKSGLLQREIAKMYGITQTGVSAIVRCEVWRV